jgi:hypothetical protein
MNDKKLIHPADHRRMPHTLLRGLGLFWTLYTLRVLIVLFKPALRGDMSGMKFPQWFFLSLVLCLALSGWFTFRDRSRAAWVQSALMVLLLFPMLTLVSLHLAHRNYDAVLWECGTVAFLALVTLATHLICRSDDAVTKNERSKQ